MDSVECTANCGQWRAQSGQCTVNSDSGNTNLFISDGVFSRLKQRETSVCISRQDRKTLLWTVAIINTSNPLQPDG